MRRRIPVFLLLGCLAAGGADAQRRADPLRFLEWPVKDAHGLVAGFSRTEALATIGAGGALLLLSRFDRTLTDGVSGITEGAHVAIVEEFGNIKVVRPIGAALLVGAFMSSNDRFQDAAFTSLEAALYANLLTNVLKSAVGRARPFQDAGPSDFSPFSGGTSFPSGHSATAFAFLSPWFLYYPSPLTAGLLVVASATAFSRMTTDFHWFSDVVGGSALGFFTAYALTRRHGGPGGGLHPVFGPDGAGLEIRF